MIIEETSLDQVKIVKNEIFEDERGFFFESFNLKKWQNDGIN